VPEPVQYRVTASTLNVRRGPSLSEPPVAWFQRDDVVTWFSTSADGYWLEVGKDAVRGWCARKFLAAVAGPLSSAFPWMAIARAELGVKESAAGDNPRILEFLRSTTLPAPLAAHDETAWCSAFVNWCVERAGLEGTDSASARSWLAWGKPVAGDPPPGCVVVLERPPNPESGHVGFLAETPDRSAPLEERRVAVLGGNQHDEVNVSRYPAARVLGFRIPGP
jgi:uncharacterized protein (TIGR02594 family)